MSQEEIGAVLRERAQKGRAADILDICTQYPQCIESADTFGRTPLYWAAAKGKVAAIKVCYYVMIF